MQYTANVIGATGLVGKELVKQLLENDRFGKVRIFVRRDSGVRHPKLEQMVIDFANEKSWTKFLTGDVLFSALGTTLKQAGGKEKQYEVDFTYNLNFARKAKENGIENYGLISSVGANSKSGVWYLRIKGELDEAVSRLGFKNLVILRPSWLVGERTEKRIMENFSLKIVRFLTRYIFKKYQAIEGKP